MGSPRCHYLWFPVLGVRGRQPGDRWRGTRHRQGGIRVPLGHLDTAVAGGGARVVPVVACPPTCSVVVRKQVGPGLGGWRGHGCSASPPFAVPPPPFRPRKCLYVAALHTSPLPADARRHCQTSLSYERISLTPKPQVKGLLLNYYFSLVVPSNVITMY